MITSLVPRRSDNWLRVATGENAHTNNDTLLCGYIEPFSLVIHGDQAQLALRTTDTYSEGFSVWYLGLEDPLTGIKQINQTIYSKEWHKRSTSY